MSKNILIGVAAFGGLVLISSLFMGKDSAVAPAAQTTEPADSVSTADYLALGVPIYTNSELAASTVSKQDGKHFVTLSLETRDTITAINDWYRSELSQNGWSIKSDKNIGGYQIIQGEKGDLYASMQAARTDKEGIVAISQQIRVPSEEK